MPVPVLFTHPLEGPHPSFVASATGFDSLADPDFLLGELFVEQLGMPGFGGQRVGLAGLKRLVIAGPVEQPRRIDLDDPRRQSLQEHAVVRDEDERHSFTQKKIFEPVDGFGIFLRGVN